MHTNSGACDKCLDVFNKYSGFNDELKTWFIATQLENPIIHISAAGRGKADQAADLLAGKTKAKYGQSPHNWNAAIDVFFLIDGSYDLSEIHFQTIVVPNLYHSLNWYGREGAPFKELPHIELTDWNEMAKNGILSLVEGL